MRSEQQWKEKFAELGALWIHDSNPKRPHALLTSGNHSDGFFNAGMVIKHPRLLAEACVDMVERSLIKEFSPQMIIGSALGAITIAHEVGRHLGVWVGFTEPVVENGEKGMVLKRFNIDPGTRVLVVEDVMTTGGTTEKTIAAVKEQGGVVLPHVLVLVNRSGKPRLGETHISALINQPILVWSPEECPLCKEGSEIVRPKGNWYPLTRQY